MQNFFLNSNPRFILCDAPFGHIKSERYHERVNVTGDSTLQAVTFCMNIQEDVSRGENLRGSNSRTFRLDVQRCDRNRVNTFGRQVLS